MSDRRTDKPSDVDKLNAYDRARNAICPYATSTTCYELETRDNLFIASGCRRWDCPVCGPRRRAALGHRIQEAKPNRLLTLTCRHEGGPLHQVDVMRKNLSKFFRDLRKTRGSIEYIRIMEECQDGYPHFHCLVRSLFLPHAELRAAWENRTGAKILDIRQIRQPTVNYCCKYVTKAQSGVVLASCKRISVSQNFWTDKNAGIEAIGWEHSRQHPVAFYPDEYREQFVATRLRTCLYRIDCREPGDEWPVELLVPMEVDPY